MGIPVGKRLGHNIRPIARFFEREDHCPKVRVRMASLEYPASEFHVLLLF
jgi:hypothetical protein